MKMSSKALRYRNLTLLTLVLAGPLPCYAGLCAQTSQRFLDGNDQDSISENFGDGTLARLARELQDEVGVDFRVSRSNQALSLCEGGEVTNSRDSAIKNIAVREVFDSYGSKEADKPKLEATPPTELFSAESPAGQFVAAVADDGIGLAVTLRNREMGIKSSVGARYKTKF